MCQFPLFETIAIIDGQPQNLPYHQQRYNEAMRGYFSVEPQLNLAEIIQVPSQFQQGLVRCRVDYNAADFACAFFPYQPRQIRTFQCVQTQGLDYRFKYADRKRFDFIQTLQADEAIIINDGFVSDCSIGNLLFLKENQWVSSSHFLLKGTQLSKLLAEGKVVLAPIKAEDLASYEKVMMINALNPFDEQRALPISVIQMW